MNQSLINIGTLLSNPHFRYPLLAVIGIQIAQIWLPQYKDQLSATQKIIMFYVIAAAANSAPSTALPPQKPSITTDADSTQEHAGTK